MFFGLLLGAASFGGAAYAAGMYDLFTFPEFPFPQSFLPEQAAWASLLAVAGGLVGMLMGGMIGGRR